MLALVTSVATDQTAPSATAGGLPVPLPRVLAASFLALLLLPLLLALFGADRRTAVAFILVGMTAAVVLAVYGTTIFGIP